MRLDAIFLAIGFLCVIAGFFWLAGGIIGFVFWAVAVVFFLLGFIAFLVRAKGKGKPPNQA